MRGTIDTDFPGGGGVLEPVEGEVVRLRAAASGVGGGQYWCVRVRGAQNGRLCFVLPEAGQVSALGPAVSRDGGRSWGWLHREPKPGAAGFSVEFGAADAEVLLAACLPYVGRDWEAWLGRVGQVGGAGVEAHAVSAGGLAVPRLRVGRGGGGAPGGGGGGARRWGLL